MPKYQRQGKSRGIRITPEGLRFLYQEHLKECKECKKEKAVCETGKKLREDGK